jgi:flagella basal body P-ring formation protein FlgA
MRRLRILLLTPLVALVLGTLVHGAQLSLRPRAELGASIVLLGDVVDIVGANDADRQELAAIPLVPAPAPGTQQFLTAAQIRDLLAAAGVNVGTLQFAGAAAVAINSPVVVAPQPTPSTMAVAELDDAAVADQLTAAMVEYLRQQTGHDMWDVELAPNEKLINASRGLGAQLTIVGGQAPWTGRQRFEVKGPGLARPLLAYARVERRQMVVIAVRPIAVGDFVRATDVELRSYAGNVSTRAAASLDAVIGKEATQAIRPETIVMTSQVRSPLLVRRGERVSVRARAAGVLVRTYATAQQDGSLGDLIQVQTLEGRERYAARVAGLRELEVFAAGTSASDVAAFGQ